MRTKVILFALAAIMLSCQNIDGQLSGEDQVKNAVREYISDEEGTTEGIQEICRICESDTLSYEQCLESLHSFMKLKEYLSPQLNSELTKIIKKVEREKPVWMRHTVPVCMKTEKHERGYVVVETNKGMRVIRLEEERVEGGYIYWKKLHFDVDKEVPLFREVDVILTKAIAYLKKEGYY